MWWWAWLGQGYSQLGKENKNEKCGGNKTFFPPVTLKVNSCSICSTSLQTILFYQLAHKEAKDGLDLQELLGIRCSNS